ncbi:DNA-3-methyladenine glycosylase [Caenispirillum salinarum AK4]|uniref:DNA-3-methyladenine glycosylase n=1 Tax=Caenispirillum salinarum AK4 TaxID=1238182 RepID=K9HQW4_9PROT|nr:DNA-3-methyladenine glycosylase I [Caenispirillum salinarum]EKV30836.1 DNA-3-methyladenine glycosylase [Caenispirillum salinarum AK4]
MNWYCDVAPDDPVHAPYHDDEYGVPVADDVVLFERLCLEVFQAGLSWKLILKKRPTLNAAFADFDPVKVAAFDDVDRTRLLADPGIIRNRLKVDATIENARRLLVLQREHGSFAAWIAAQHPLPKDQWVKRFRKTFKFMGGEVVGEFLMSIGYLPGAHREDCPAMGRIRHLDPPWMRAAVEAEPTP